MTQAGPSAAPAPDQTALLRQMWFIRAFEERMSELYAEGRIKGLLHLGIGQEAIAVGVAAALRAGDIVVGTHRAHAHALAKGVDPAALVAELAGRTSGLGRGKGGSMHIAAPEVGFLTATGVVGGGIALALGAAYAGRVLDIDRVALAFFGDGAGQTGTFHESLNLAALWRLPVIFFCENNGYAEFTPLSAHTPVERLAAHAAVYAIPAVTIDGNDVMAVHAAVAEAAGACRSGQGPRFVEALTYRLRGHYEGDPARYRELAEVAAWRARDPIAVLRDRMYGTDSSVAADREPAAIEIWARAEVDAAVEAGLAGPLPDDAEVLRDVLAPDRASTSGAADVEPPSG